MKRAHLACVTSALLSLPLLAGCDTSPLVVVENDGGEKGTTTDSGIKGTGDDSGIKGTGDDSGIKGTEDSSVNDNDAGAGACVTNVVTFDLAIGTTGNVWLAGSTPPWPASSFGCPGWLTIIPPAESSIGSPWGGSVNLLKDACLIACPPAQPVPAAAQSFTWDGTYYPVTSNSNPNMDCDTPACAPAGDYLATMCVGYAGEDAGAEGPSSPTCQTFQFAWPPGSPSGATVQTTITPTPGGG
jgi:hypothetical protein